VVILGQGRVLADGALEALRSRLGTASLEEAFLTVLSQAEAQALGDAL
jgi:ABC-type Na+ transport system ATPase subunit NatA